MRGWRVGAVLLLGIVAGCATSPVNPSFPLSVEEGERALAEMRRRPARLERPVLIVGGFLEPGVMPPGVRSDLAPLFVEGDRERFVTTALATAGDFDACREKLIEVVDERFRGEDAGQTVEVDVIAISMGGVAARYAAAPLEGRRRLNVKRLFTIASPHQGAKLAGLPTLSRLQKDMRKGSAFMGALPEPDYPVIAYTRLGDELVGEENTSADGEPPWWVPNRPLESSHLRAYADPRILADIGRRLRGEEPFTKSPPAPLPTKGR